jgi:CHAT domain-containing protein
MWKTAAGIDCTGRKKETAFSGNQSKTEMNSLKLGALFGLFSIVLIAAPNENAVAALQKADHLADLYNWADAGPFFLIADKGLPPGSPQQIHAHLGYLRATMESRSLPEFSNHLADMLKSPVIASNPRLRMWCLGIKGDADGEMDTGSARADWEEAHRVAEQLNDKKWESRSLAEAGFEAYLQGDIAVGRRSVAAGLGAAHKTGDAGAEVRYLSAIGAGIEWNGSYKEAMDYFAKAHSLAQQNPDIGFPFLTVEAEVETLIHQHKYSEAQQLSKTAESNATQHDKRIKLTQFMLFDADIALGENQPDRAIAILQKAISLAQGNQTRMLGDAETKLAHIYRDQHKLAMAEHYAAAAFMHTHLTKDLFTAPARLEFAAQLQWDLGHRAEARRSIMRALEISEGLLSQTSSGKVREGLLTEMSSAYETAFKFAAESGDVNGAFSVIERVRGRITAETLVQPLHPSTIPANIALEDKIRNFKVQLIKAGSDQERGRLIDALFYAQQQEFVEDKPAPVYGSRIESVALKKVTANLDQDEALLEYVLPQNGSAYCLVLSAKSASIVQLRSAAEIATLARTLADDIKTRKPWRKDSQALYAAIMAPIPNVSAYKHLIVVPDGDLHSVPFETLESGSGKLVAETAATAYSPSAVSYYLLKNRSNGQTEMTFLGVGGAIYNPVGAKPFTIAKDTPRGADVGVDLAKLPNLPSSGKEVEAAVKALNATKETVTLQVGPNATEFAFTHAPLANYEIVHLAIHAVADKDDPSRAALIFPADPQHPTDRLLEPSDIASLRFGARVVVLSACNTAVGRLQGQVGVANLARAFLQAGADSVVSTLWPVDDLQSLFLMKAFYAHLAAGMPAADALASAKRDMLHESGTDTSPLSWAGFVLLGNGDASLHSSRLASIQTGRAQ